MQKNSAKLRVSAGERERLKKSARIYKNINLVRMKLSGITVTSETQYELLSGLQVLEVMEEAKFQHEWDELSACCTESTVFQSRQFVTTWYKIYHHEYLPILVKAEREGKLTGIVALAKDKRNLITGAGAGQAEYHSWLTSDADGGCTFMKQAIREVLRHFSRASIHFKYVPANTAIAWLYDDPSLAGRYWVREHKQPILELDAPAIDKELRKKNRREKLNRLKRLGNLQFERITDIETFRLVFDDLATQSDFRKGARYNRCFFRTDPLRKAFFLALFQEHLLHATLLRLDNAIIASNVSVYNRSQAHLQGINTHAPTHARYSPGILHFLMLGRLLAEEGTDVFDLTPGADTYKEVLANSSKTVYEIYVGNVFTCFRDTIKFRVTDAVKEAHRLFRLDVNYLRSLKRRKQLIYEKLRGISSKSLPTSMLMLLDTLFKNKKAYPYILQAETQDLVTSPPVRHNNLNDLLNYEQGGSWLTRWEFLEQAMRRYEAGEQSYSWSEQGRLLGCV
ncbi:MAG TPA: GNAT family N-acetyltransferase, partial [Pontibacter sp.]